jgi:hypothetical protein
MNKLGIAVAAASAWLPIVMVLPASASPAETADGTFTSTVGVAQVQHVGNNTIFHGPEVQHLTGALQGIRVASGVMIVHADGSFEARDRGLFTGTVDGRSGTIEIDGVSNGVGSTGAGQLVLGHGTGGLAGLHGRGTFAPRFTSVTTATGTYAADIHFER